MGGRIEDCKLFSLGLFARFLSSLDLGLYIGCSIGIKGGCCGEKWVYIPK